MTGRGSTVLYTALGSSLLSYVFHRLIMGRLQVTRLAVLVTMVTMLAAAQLVMAQDDSEKHSAVVPEQQEEVS